MTGRPEDTSDEEILDFLRESEDLVFSTKEVAEALSYSQPGMFRRLRKLEEKGQVESKKLGGTKAWWLSERS
ncbi:winged helix-turn-helix transcriptional regulator [Halorubrum sp. DTA98]|uniref:winged helix-turn-helix transcriptional regulator n=1 Tax=Halorubrum sp. DTA98 TaxID=3402163 RepID=UPI003AAE14C7